MDWKNKVLNPKGWLMAFGLIFILLGTGNYLTAETAAETAYPDPTDRDVFYEQTFGLLSMALAVMALTTALVVTGRPLSILAMTSSGVMIVMMSLHYMAGEAVDYGYNDPVVLGVVLTLIATMGVSGYLHLNDEEGEEAPAAEA
jgi:FtsH-binding integral membrane protein